MIHFCFSLYFFIVSSNWLLFIALTLTIEYDSYFRYRIIVTNCNLEWLSIIRRNPEQLRNHVQQLQWAFAQFRASGSGWTLCHPGPQAAEAAASFATAISPTATTAAHHPRFTERGSRGRARKSAPSGSKCLCVTVVDDASVGSR